MSFFISFIIGIALFYLRRFFPITAVILFIVFAHLTVFLKYGYPREWRHHARNIALTLMGIFVAAPAGVLYARMMYSPGPRLSDSAGETVVVTGTLKSEAVPLPSGEAFSQLMEISGASDSRGKPLNIREMRITGPGPLLPGRSYTAAVTIPESAALLNPGSSTKILSGNIKEVKDNGAFSPGLFASARLRLNHFISARFSAESAPFLMSVITGERSLLTREVNTAFNVTGLAHILSISGAHFGLLLFVLFRFFKGVVGMLPYRFMVRVSLYVTPSQLAALLSIPVVTGYLGISDMSFPAVRSFIMIMLFLFGLLVQRRGFWLNTLLLAAVIILLMQPEALLDLSFQLSFIAVLCIGQATEALKSAETPASESPKAGEPASFGSSAREYLRSSLFMSLAATAGTAPLVAHYFHYFSLVSPLTNLVITPFIGFIIVPPALLASFFFLATGYFPLLSFIDWGTSFMISSVCAVAKWGYADTAIPAFPAVTLVVFYGALLLYILSEYSSGRAATARGDTTTRSFRKFPLFLAAALSPFLIFTVERLSAPKGIQVTYLDVGQGDAAVIELPDDKILVMDTGKSGLQAAEFLRYRGKRKIDALALSHGQFDHVGGARYLVDNFKVGEIWDNGRLIYPPGFPESVHRRSVQRGDTLRGEGYVLTILHTYDGYYAAGPAASDDNNDSLVLRIAGEKQSFLFTGDLEKQGEEDMLHLGENLKSSVLKVPHHGSRSSASAEFIHAVSPAFAVISVGRGNRYGHPHEETLSMLTGVGILRTDRDGAVGIKASNDDRAEVKIWKDYQPAEANSPRDEWLNMKRLINIW